ncbi:hypothetical protein MPSEU_000342100 [Mayamaea pseudoterrestris]|nr:hypothetical protein MPSEU_000342100 [Mayamaea pseudoterrestris]
MKLNTVTAIFFMTAPLAFAAKAGTRNIEELSNKLNLPTPAHHRHLATSTKEKYSTVGYGASADVYWMSGNCDYGSTFYLSAFDGVSKYQSNGKPSKTTGIFAYGSLDTWSNCDESSATHTSLYFDVYDGSDASLAVASKLETATFSVDKAVFVVTETCIKICDSDEYGNEWCYYGDCSTASDGFADMVLKASWTATGTASTSSWTSKYSVDGYSYRGSYKGKDRPASVDLTFTLDGIAVDIPSEGEFFGLIQQATNGGFSKY